MGELFAIPHEPYANNRWGGLKASTRVRDSMPGLASNGWESDPWFGERPQIRIASQGSGSDPWFGSRPLNR